MKNCFSILFNRLTLTSFCFFLILPLIAFSAKKPQVETRAKIGKTLSTVYGYPDVDYQVQNNSSLKTVSLGSFASEDQSFQSPGITVGDTWFDYQHNGRMGRMIDWSPYRAGATDTTLRVQFSLTKLCCPSFSHYKTFYYRYWDVIVGARNQQSAVDPFDHSLEFVNLDVTPEGRAVIGCHTGHVSPSNFNFPIIYYEFLPGFDFFSSLTGIYDSLSDVAGGYTGAQFLWPTFQYQFGTDTVTHIFAQEYVPGDVSPQAIGYFRKIGLDASGDWDYFYIVDTVFTISQTVVASRISDKVALAWTANLPLDGDCPTCSDDAVGSQYDNDLYYMISDDQGLTWDERVNLTNYRETRGIENSYRAYADLSILLDSDDNLHIIWPGIVWPADNNPQDLNRARLFHWSEDVPYIRTIHSEEQSGPNCAPGVWNLNIAKPQISECDNKLYALWVQVFDFEEDRLDDCAARANTEYLGSGNGDLYISVSDNSGLTWDPSRNITRTSTPGCDPSVGYNCESENWPSMARFGRQNLATELYPDNIVDPSGGSYTGNYFLDVQYILDKDPGGIAQSEGTWQLVPLRWIRLACVEPVPGPKFYPSWREISEPFWIRVDIQLDTNIVIENAGNVDLTYDLNIVELNGPAGWLQVIGASGTVPSGVANTESISVTLNSDNIISNYGEYNGLLVFTGNQQTSPDTIFINLLVLPNLEDVASDTIFNDNFYLSYNNMGSVGGGQSNNGVNMDYVWHDYNGPDCTADTLNDPQIPVANKYLNEGSTVIGWIEPDGDDPGTDPDTVMNFSIFGNSFMSDNSFRPLGGMGSDTSPSGYSLYSSGVFVTHDSSIAINKIFIAPDNVDYIIQALKVWSYDSATHNGLMIGEIIDWDVPADSGFVNLGSTEYSNEGLIYQRGWEAPDGHLDTANDYSTSGDTLECQENDARFAGLAFVESRMNYVFASENPHNGYILENQNFDAHYQNLVSQVLYENMTEFSGYSTVSTKDDLYMGMCYHNSLTLGPTDVYTVYTVISTVMNGSASDLLANVNDAKAWLAANDPAVIIATADADNDGALDAYDNCVGVTNYGNVDMDQDGVGDVCDNCPLHYNPNQQDRDGDGHADACDNCPEYPNPDQSCNPCIEPDGCDVCCIANRGNVDGDLFDNVDIADIVYAVEYQFSQPPGPEPLCFEEADVAGDPVDNSPDQSFDIADIVYMVDYQFNDGPPPPACPPEKIK